MIPLPSEDLAHVLDRTRALWEEMRGQQIFITGGTGFFGGWLLESFAHANETLGLQARALVLTRQPAEFARRAPHLAGRADLGFLAGDVRDFAFPAGAFHAVIHAGTASVAPVPPREMFETIVDGTRRVLEFAASHDTRKFLFVSSGAVYGRQPPGLTHVPETHPGSPDPTDPASAYGEGKRAAELLCVLQGQETPGMETKIARGFAFVGPRLPLDAHFAVGNFIRDALQGRRVDIQGDGTPYRSYLYASDLAIWLWTILLKGAAGRPYNVGSEDGLPIGELAAAVSEALGAKAGVSIARPALAGSVPARYVPSTLRARTELGLAQTVNLAEAVRRTARHALL